MLEQLGPREGVLEFERGKKYIKKGGKTTAKESLCREEISKGNSYGISNLGRYKSGRHTSHPPTQKL